MMSFWRLDPDVTHLNHGSFGATPAPALEEQRRLRDAMESNPTRWFLADYQPALDQARSRVADFVGSDPAGLGFVNNATEGVNSVLRSLEADLRPGDEIVVPDHSYNACRNAVEVTAARTGARVVTAAIPFPLRSASEVTDRILGAIEERIRYRRFDANQDGHAVEALRRMDNYRWAIDHNIRGSQFGSIVWKARTLRTGPGRAAEEKRHGADLMGVLDIDLPGYRVAKGFLAQAKRAEPNCRFSQRDWDRLHSQCEKMLLRTPDSFVFVYSKSRGIRIFPATAVLGLKSRNIFELYDRRVSSFFESHIVCVIGDLRLNSTDIETLEALSDLPIERVLELSARPPE
jgi:hypothetical protein